MTRLSLMFLRVLPAMLILSWPVFAAPAAGSACEGAMEPLVSVEMAWGPKEALRQARLLSAALDSVKPGVPGKRDVYVLSAALWGEHVFDQEAAGAAAILSERYDAKGRTVVLSNGAAALGRDRPAATPDNFSAALAKIGESMNPKEDVLFLFVTSHGQQGKGALVFEPKRLQSQLPPARLKAELDEAGIKNRVLIISTCFAGVYIPVLQDGNTAILTAASADRSSFGCQPERDWTYFGDALFGNSLSGENTLLSGFDKAKILISMWEEKLGVVPSDPQQSVGAGAVAFLADLEKRRTVKQAMAPR